MLHLPFEKVEIYQWKLGLVDCKWSNLNAPGPGVIQPIYFWCLLPVLFWNGKGTGLRTTYAEQRGPHDRTLEHVLQGRAHWRWWSFNACSLFIKNRDSAFKPFLDYGRCHKPKKVSSVGAASTASAVPFPPPCPSPFSLSCTFCTCACRVFYRSSLMNRQI